MSEQNEKNDKKTSDEERPYTDPETGKFKEGNPGGGRPKGSLDFKTKFYKFLDKLAEQEGIDPDELEEEIYQSYYDKAVQGDRAILKDILDRIHGKPLKRTDVTTQGEKVGQSRELTDEEKELLKKTLKYARKGIDKSGQEDTE